VIASGKTVIGADTSAALYTVHDEKKAHFYCIKWETEDGTKGINHYLQGTPLFDYDWYVKCMKKIGIDQFEGF